MIEFEKPRIECLKLDNDNMYAKFVCEPLERGYGITLGNSLRRILLSSLPGAAITSIKVDGVQHEFTTIPGIVEDVVEMILNLKNVRLKITDNEEKYLKIDVDGEGGLFPILWFPVLFFLPGKLIHKILSLSIDVTLVERTIY